MWTPESKRARLLIIGAVTTLTLAVHYYQWTFAALFGHAHWLHAIHARLCYIPIVLAATWFGLRGGLWTAGTVSFLVLPYIFRGAEHAHELPTELVELVFYFAIATIIGVIVDRERSWRLKQEAAKQQVERSQKLSLVGQLAACVAHEIKNPLASIKGAADILTDDDTSATERVEFKGILQGEIRRIDTIVGEFLEFARPKETQMEKLDLTRTVGATMRQMEAHARRQGLTVVTSLADDVIIDGDGEKLHQMALNLVLNAIQASKQGDTISVSLTDRGAEGVQLIVADTGAGISSTDLETIFEPFFTTRPSGTGLGLAVVKDIVESHSGNVHVDSRPGAGTTVTVTLPRSGQVSPQ